MLLQYLEFYLQPIISRSNLYGEPSIGIFVAQPFGELAVRLYLMREMREVVHWSAYLLHYLQGLIEAEVRDVRCASYGIYYKYIHSLHLLQLLICNGTAVCYVAKLAKPVSKYREFVVHNPYRYHLGNVAAIC